MPLTELTIIKNYFHRLRKQAKNVVVGIGDDAAVIEIPKGQQVVISVDTLVEGVHFPINTPPRDLGHKALAVSLSDIASMGAIPHTALLALTIQKTNEIWLKAFAEGFFSLADRYQVSLIGGDVTQGPLCISITATGLIPKNEIICRNGAIVGDLIYLTGTVGDAGLALTLLKGHKKIDPFLLTRLNCPTPRIEAGVALRGITSAAIDISDGVVTDLEKMVRASQVGAKIYVERLPLSDSLKRYCPLKKVWEYALASGDDYELCFTVPKERSEPLEEVFHSLDCECRCIGEIIQGEGVTVIDPQNRPINMAKKGYEHFSNA